MKYKILLKSFLVLVLIITFSVQVIYASEITGNLSSSSTQSGGGGSGSEVSGTVGNGTIAGNVSGGSTSGSGGGNSGGAVLGASTVTSNPSLNNISADGTALRPSSQSLALGGTMGEPTLIGDVLGAETAEAAPFQQTTTISEEITGMNTSTWFWIILLILLFIATTIYIYSRRENKNRA